MTLRCSLRHLVLSSAFLVIAACVSPMNPDGDVETTDSASQLSPSAGQGTPSGLDTATAASYRRACGRGIAQCSPEQAGQQCNANDPLFLCVEQTSGAFCCLPVAL